MFENITKFFKKFNKKEENISATSKDAAKERLHLVLMQDRANVSVDFLEMMKQEIIEVIKKYIDVDEKAIDVRLTNKENDDGTNGAPALYANIPILNIKNDVRKMENEKTSEMNKNEEKSIKEEKDENVSKSKKTEIEKDKKAGNKETNSKENNRKETNNKETIKEDNKKETNNIETLEDNNSEANIKKVEVLASENVKEKEVEEIIIDDTTTNKEENAAKDEVKSEN